MSPNRAVLAWVLVSSACGGGEGTESSVDTGDDSAGSTSTTTTSSSTTSSSGSTTDAESETSAAATSSESGSTSDAGSSESGPPTIPCGDTPCLVGDVCVIPCCGGAGPPPCYDPDDQLACNGMDALVSPGKCDMPCTNQRACCKPGACVPDPPFCVTESELTCMGTDCNFEDCFGYYEMDFLNCTCA